MPNKKKPTSKKAMLIVSFAAAFVLWFIVSVFINPQSTRTLSGIPVSVTSGAQMLDALGLDIVDADKLPAVSVEISGNRVNLVSLTADDFTVVPKFAGVSKAGIYTLDLTVSLDNADGNVEITSFYPRKVDITVARTDTVKLPITYTIGTVPEGYFLSSVTLADQFVSVTGPDSAVERVSSAVVTIDDPVNGTVSRPIRLLDEMGNSLDDLALSTDISSTDVTVSLLKTKQLSLTATLTDLPAGVTADAVKLTVSPATVTVAGPEDIINAMKGTYSVADVSIGSVDATEAREVELTLPTGVITVDDAATVTVQIDASGVTCTHRDITHFAFSSSLSGYDVTVTTPLLRNVEIAGPAEIIDAVSSDDLIATVVYDGAQPLQKGAYYTLSVQISSPTESGFWVVDKDGSYTVNVKVN